MASTLVRRGGCLRLYNKGAAEVVLAACSSLVNATGQTLPMTEVRVELPRQCHQDSPGEGGLMARAAHRPLRPGRALPAGAARGSAAHGD